MKRNSQTRDLKPVISSKLSALTDNQIEFLFSVNLKWLHTDQDFLKIKSDKRNSKQFISWLETMSQLEWEQIDTTSRSRQGWEKIEEASLKIKIPHDFINESIISFHWWENRSIVGVRRQGIFCPFSIELDAGNNKHYKH